MKHRLKWTLLTTGALLFLSLAATVWYLSKAAPIGSGYVAKYLCSSTYISQRDPVTVFKQDIIPVNPIAGWFDYTIDREKKKVTADLHGVFERTAIYREGCGCTLIIGTTEDKVRKQPMVTPGFDKKRLQHRHDLAWPYGNGNPVNPEEVGVDPIKLREALDKAFDEPFPDHRRKTRAVVVVYKGTLIAERYADGFNRDMPLMGWSMSKSITNALTGILVHEGRLDILKPASLPQWREEELKSKITFDHLLRMSSGLAFDEIYTPLFDAAHMLYDSHSLAAFAAAKPMEAEPDAKWQYSSGTSNILAEVLRERMESVNQNYFDYIYRKLFHKIGMFSAVMEPDASGTFVGSSYTLATALDWARFGQLYLQDGVWQGERILPEGWINYSTTPTKKAPKGRYGAHFWLNAGTPDDPTDRPWPNAPKDTFAALGFQGQNVIIIPSRKTVLVRLGASTGSNAWSTDQFIHKVLSALPTK